MAKVVAALSISHAPGALGWPDAPMPDMKKRLDSAADTLGRYLDASKPDVIIAFLDDHFENHFRNLMPTVSIGVAVSNSGPADQWLDALQIKQKTVFPAAPDTAEELLRGVVERGFDVTRMGEIEYGNNLLVPWILMAPTVKAAIIPVYFNVFSPPLMSASRAFSFGEAVRDVVEKLPADLRVAFVATGGLSHWPPFWHEQSPDSDIFLQRMKRFQTEGMSVLEDDPELYSDLGKYEIDMANTNQFPKNSSHPLVNPDWDLEFLKAIETGDVEYIRAMKHDDIQERGGHGGFEVLNWIALMGAMKGQPGRIVAYEAVIEWICGMGYVTYDI